jgi:adenylate cyclase class IV
MKKNIEVELRGPLTEEEYNKLKSFLIKKANNKSHKNRILIDYSSCLKGAKIRDRNIDIRARITNGTPEMIIKVGKWKGSDIRKEISVLLQKGQFSNLISAYAALGYRKGILCIRNILSYNYNNIEFALVEVPEHSYFFEAEILLSSEERARTAKKKIKETCTNLGLRLFSDTGWFNYIEKLNKEANTIFDIDKDGEDYFMKKYNI